MTKAVRLDHGDIRVLTDPARKGAAYWPSAIVPMAGAFAAGWAAADLNSLGTWRPHQAAASHHDFGADSWGKWPEEFCLAIALRRIREAETGLEQSAPDLCAVLLDGDGAQSLRRKIIRAGLAAGYRRVVPIPWPVIAKAAAARTGGTRSVVIDIGANGLRLAHVIDGDLAIAESRDVGFLGLTGEIIAKLEQEESAVASARGRYMRTEEIYDLAEKAAIAIWRDEITSRGLRFSAVRDGSVVHRILTNWQLRQLAAEWRARVHGECERLASQLGIQADTVGSVVGLGGGARVLTGVFGIDSLLLAGGGVPEVSAVYAVAEAIRERPDEFAEHPLTIHSRLTLGAINGSGVIERRELLKQGSPLPAQGEITANELELQQGQTVIAERLRAQAHASVVWNVSESLQSPVRQQPISLTLEGESEGARLFTAKYAPQALSRLTLVDPFDPTFERD